MIGHAAPNGVDVFAGHHLPVIVVGLAVLVLVTAVDLVQRLLEMVLVQVAGCDHLDIIHAQKGVGVPGAHHTPADDPHRDPLGWCGSTGALCSAGGE